MSYQVLARKYRPKNFETLVGQEHVVRALTHALRTGRLHHAYLFTGTRGVGKTTLSRILAKSLNCTGPDGQGEITAEPCGVCEACRAIDAGRFVDYIEMDAASNRGVDEMAQLLEQAVYAPSNARFKVYMIDEVHMLTNHAFNAMLKTLEEPPPHVKFILATTDPQKIPVTVLSRCLQFNLKQMPPGHIVGHLENILGQENVTFEQPALRLLAQGAHGSMRDALSLTDQAIAYAAGQVTLDAVQGMLGALDQSYLVRLLDALAKQDGADLMAVADEMASRSLSYNGALQDLGTLLHRVALAQSVPGAVPQDLPELADIMRLATLFEPQEVQLYYQIAVHGRNEIGLAPDEYAGFTMTLLRMLAFRPGQGGAEASAAPPAAAPMAAPGARAAAAATASHAAVTPRPPPAAAAAPARPAQGGAAHQAPPAPGAPQGGGPAPAPAPAPAAAAPAAPAMTSARAAINAALEAARAASGMRQAPKRPGADAAAAAPAPAPSAPPPPPPPAAPGPSASMPSAPQMRQAAPAVGPSGTPPWDNGQPQAMARPQPAMRAQPADDEPPSWVTEFSDDTAVASEAPAVVAPVPAAPVRAPAKPPHAYVITPVPQIGWDGNWPALAGSLPLRGVAQQLALQTELIGCTAQDRAVTFRLRVPVDTLRASGNTEKLTAALQEHFPDLRVTVESEIGPVWYTASAEQKAAREERQRLAESIVAADPFVQELEQRFDAFVVPGSVKVA
ncbi:DNA polymerase III subunit gamma/tau [Massilia sp. YIM B02443]|uniref:DNA polymerase III subunit gamma/tau n=1 Tax=Massilia sp. YIM B02443 TaxID=3050127 RepID=UPI0025B6E540|nr:DNA polymerase III subunit gamma/tau [Massilia sp. YIM B02443]MDN4038702.1 DNA polymerase III subunit gamma/tau [Massilia sp. YIM B02443]